MSGFLYFIPKLQSASKEDISKAGLYPTFGSSSFGFRSTSLGPNKQSGAIIVIKSSNPEAKTPQVGYFPEKQDWQENIPLSPPSKGELKGDVKFWIGKEKENPPKPVDLQRKELVDGHLTKLEDGNDWLIPAARIFPQGTTLPQSLILGPNGELVQEILPKFAQLGKKAEELWLEFQRENGMLSKENTSEPIGLKARWDIAISALAVNYKIGQDEVSFLRLLTTENLTRILAAIIDIPVLISVMKASKEAFKKKAQSDTKDTKIIKDGNKA